MRGRLCVLAAGSVLLVAAGCGGGALSASARSPSNGQPGRGLLAGRLARAGCSTAVAAARPLPARTGFLRLGGPPFGVAVARDGRWVFVDELGGHVAVLSATGFLPRLVRTITVPQDAVGNSLTTDGRNLLIADGGDGATVVSVERAEAGDADPVLGALTRRSGPGSAGGAIEVTSSPNGRYAFVSLEGTGDLAVYDLHAALGHRFRRSSYVGSVPLGIAPVGMAVSPDGRWLYATSEIGRANNAQGTLSVIDIAKAETDPSHSVAATVAAHCSPVRVTVSAGGKIVWVTARESDQLLAFSAAKLRSDPTHALLAAVRVGEAPVGLTLVDHGRDVIVADSNRFAAPGARAQLTVVSIANALAHRPAVLGTIRAGSFPREMALEPSVNTLLVGNFASDQLEAVSVTSLP